MAPNAGLDEKPDTLVHEIVPEKDVHEVNVAIQLAEGVATASYSPWSPNLLRLYGCLSIAYLCGCLNGYDGSLMGALNAMKTYEHYFHMLVLTVLFVTRRNQIQEV
jgi:hypothetical protein